MEIPGIPANEAGTVKISFKYIFIGSSSLSPIGKAALGVVGVRIKSHSLKAFSKSFAINFLTFCADGVVQPRLEELYEALDPFSENLIVLMESDSTK